MRILLSGGGTGGHAVPIIALVSEIRSYFKDGKVDLLWIGSKYGPEKKLAEENNIPFMEISSGKLRRYWSFKNISDFFRIAVGFFQAFFIIRKFKPDVMFGKGGYVSVPAVLASRFLSVPSMIHESDYNLGLANKILLPYVDKAAVTFQETLDFLGKYKDKGVVTGNPIRSDILKGDKERAYDKLNLDRDKPVILVMGGSQGAVKINEAVAGSLPGLLDKYQVIHLCGDKNYEDLKNETSKIAGEMEGYKLYPSLYGDQLADVLACADLIISRAGLNTLFEIALLGKPSIIIPYPYAAGNHQEKNAKYFEKEGAIALIGEDDLNSELLARKINELFESPDKLKGLGGNNLKIGRRLNENASQKILKELLAIKK